MYHLREHLPDGHKKKRSQIATACPDYDLLADVVNVSKHGELTINNPQISKAENIFEEKVYTKYKDDEGEFFGVENTIIIKLDNGTIKNLCSIITKVLNYWCSHFHSLGVISSVLPFEDNSINHPLTREQVALQKNDLAMIRGVRFHQHMKLQEYNYDTGQIIPIDLTGCQVKMSIYKTPKITPVLQLKNDDTGEIIFKEIPLTDEEYAHFESLEKEEEKQKYISKLASDTRSCSFSYLTEFKRNYRAKVTFEYSTK